MMDEIIKQAWRHCQRADSIVGLFNAEERVLSVDSSSLLAIENNEGGSKWRSNEAAGEARTADVPSGVR
jgi:hypothetical protein